MLKYLWKKLCEWTHPEIARERDAYIKANQDLLDVNRGLEHSLGEVTKQYKSERYEKILSWSAIAYQAGGKFLLPKLFLDLVEKGDFHLDVKLDPQGNEYAFILEDSAQPETPFSPGEASTGDFDYDASEEL